MQRRPLAHPAAEDGVSLIELLVSMGITLVIVGATMQALSGVLRSNHTALNVTGMNGTLRTAMDLMTRDLLQTGQGLPTGRTIPVPNGAGSVPILLPGPPTTAFQLPAGTTEIAAIVPGPDLGPVVNGVPTDVVTILLADGAFDHVTLTNLQSTRMTVATPRPPAGGQSVRGMNINTGGPGDLLPGNLIMLEKGSEQTLVQVTSVSGQVANFVQNDSLALNQPNAANGNTTWLMSLAPPDAPGPAPEAVIPTTATRIFMITYYIDNTTSPGRPRLVRRMNNGDAMSFNNNLGSTVAFDVTGLQVTYDLADGGTNPTNVRMTPADIDGTGVCAPASCGPGQIRKVNVVLTGVGRRGSGDIYYNTLASQVSLRSMALVDRYR